MKKKPQEARQLTPVSQLVGAKLSSRPAPQKPSSRSDSGSSIFVNMGVKKNRRTCFKKCKENGLASSPSGQRASTPSVQ